MLPGNSPASFNIRRERGNPSKSLAEAAWATHPDPRLIGKWVVLEGDAVLASGEDPKSIYEQARSKGIASPFLIFVSGEDGAFAGGRPD